VQAIALSGLRDRFTQTSSLSLVAGVTGLLVVGDGDDVDEAVERKKEAEKKQQKTEREIVVWMANPIDSRKAEEAMMRLAKYLDALTSRIDVQIAELRKQSGRCKKLEGVVESAEKKRAEFAQEEKADLTRRIEALRKQIAVGGGSEEVSAHYTSLLEDFYTSQMRWRREMESWQEEALVVADEIPID